MNAITISQWIKSLGRNYDELVSQNVIPDQALVPLQAGEDNDELILYPVVGVELWFWGTARKLEKILLTLIPTGEGDEVYKGSLPLPFELSMSRSSVRGQLGTPMASREAARIPGSGGQMFGGWDAYRLDEIAHPNTRVGFSYSADLMVKSLAFALIDTGHN
ncbi:pyocin immunity protein [Pseudomonas yamanorum]|uniref:DUF6392 family protein n=1 Tax=Pseudomonas yamanorum TaxID=515393 RepID=UPI0015A1500D|nr:DUF6392 family protein [Pseudomonas yamanorum]NWE38385.1 pyocin immunity protein [Pseudomonas yamanorum]